MLLMRKLLAVWLLICMLLGTGMLFQAALATDLEEEQPSGENSALAFQDVIRYAEVATPKGTLNMRSKPQDEAKILKRLPKGSIVRILEDNGEWTKVLYEGISGYAKTSFIEEIKEFPYSPLTKEDKGDAVLVFKRALHKLGYLKTEDINTRFDATMETALTKLQLMNGIPLNPEVVTPELQALMAWGMLVKNKTGYVDTATDKGSGLTVSIFCWDSDGTLYEEDQSVKLKISFAAQAAGGQAPYTITVKKSISEGGEQSGDAVTSPFSHIWSKSTECLYIYATVVDAAGNTVTACAPFRYTLPSRYTGK